MAGEPSACVSFVQLANKECSKQEQRHAKHTSTT
jgi:hypothetical protein